MPLLLGEDARVVDCVDLEGRAQITSVAVSAVAAQSAALPEGVYDVWCDVDVFLKVDPVANNVTTATGYLLRANNTMAVLVRGNSKIGAITASGSGTLRAHLT